MAFRGLRGEAGLVVNPRATHRAAVTGNRRNALVTHRLSAQPGMHKQPSAGPTGEGGRRQVFDITRAIAL